MGDSRNVGASRSMGLRGYGFISLALAAIGIVAIALLLSKPVQAGGGTVTNCSNDTELTNKLAGGGSITFSCGGPQTIIFASQKIITRATTIDGGGLITFSGNNLTRTFFVQAGAQLTLTNLVFYNGNSGNADGGAIYSDGALVIANSAFISNSTAITSYYGGAIQSHAGSIVITNSQFLQNRSRYGGALYADVGNLLVRISNSRFQSNTAFASGGAAKLYANGLAEISGSIFDHNEATTLYGGAVESYVPITVTDSIFSYNSAGQDGGGFILSNSTAVIKNSEFYSNSSAYSGGIENAGILTIINSSIHHNIARTGAGGVGNYGDEMWLTDVDIYENVAANWGGGVDNEYGPGHLDRVRIFNNRVLTGSVTNAGGGISAFYSSGALTVTNSSIYGNQVNGSGGGIHASYGVPVFIKNTAIYSNVALNGNGGGVDAGGFSGGAFVTLINTTLANNYGDNGGGLSNATVNPPVIMTNVTFYNNTAIGGGNITGTAQLFNTLLTLGTPANCNTTVTSTGNNLEFGNSCGLNSSGDLTNTDPLLVPGFAGSMFVAIPPVGSPAIDHGGDSGCPSTDQRGFPRPVGIHCDIGAIEIAHSTYLPLVLKNQ